MFRRVGLGLLVLLLCFSAWARSGLSPHTPGFTPLDRDRPHGGRGHLDDEDRDDRGPKREHGRDEDDDEDHEDEDRDDRGRKRDRDHDEDRDDEDDDRDHDHDEDGRGKGHHHERREGDAYDEDYAYYGRVQATRPEVVVGRRVLVGDLALLRFLAPGMRVEVEGRVEDGRIRVKAVHVHHPKNWAFYEGPTPEGWSRVWYAGGRPWRVQAADPGPRVRLLACYEGGWRGLPEPLRPALRPPRSGLWLLEGLLWQGEVRWTRQTRLGACHE